MCSNRELLPLKRCATVCAALLALGPSVRAADMASLLAERVKSCVAVEYVVETESERHPTVAYGVAIDNQGTIILPGAAIDARLAVDELKDFRVYVPGEPVSYAASYLGQDAFTGWHFIRAEKKLAPLLTPITAFAARAGQPAPGLADEVWGIGLRPKEEDFLPYIMQSHVALIQLLPQRTAGTQQEIAGPGLPVFNREGELAGLALSSGGQTYMMYSQAERSGAAVMMVDVEESTLFAFASEVLPYLNRVPRNVNGRPLAWLGAYGLEPMDREVAAFLKLSSQSGAVVSEVLEGSPAEAAGMKDRDIIIAIDGRPIPRFRPDRVVVDYVDREIERRRPGDTLALSVLRGSDRVEIRALLGEEPRLINEAQRKYFEKVGMTVREFVYGDAVARRIRTKEAAGVVVHFVKTNGPAEVAGLQADDWIKEIDGVSIRGFDDAVAKLSAIEADPLRTEFVALTSRDGETAVARIKLR